MENLVTIVLIVAGAIIIILAMTGLFKQVVFWNVLCKSTVYLSDQVLGFVDPICKTQYKEFKDKEDLAESMATAWNVFGEGNLNPSGTNWFKWNELRCFKYYRGDVKEELIGVTGGEFQRYLVDTKGKNAKKSYWNYFNKGEVDFKRVIVGFDKLEEGDLIAILYFEEVESAALNPSSWVYNLLEALLGDIEDRIVVVKDNPGVQVNCVEI